MRVSDFDYFLPDQLIAQEPLEPRDTSRLLVLHRDSGRLEEKVFRDLGEYLEPGDVLVLNDTRVIPARLFGSREGTGAKIEVVLLTRRSKDTWEALVRPGRRARVGTRIVFGAGELVAEVVDTTEAGGRVLNFQYEGAFEEILDTLGQMPLPPYITRELQDKERYQTVYAREEGSAAAPTAGLHFTPSLLQELEKQGVELVRILLHVGLGTFRPVKADKVEDHLMHAEFYQISPEAAEAINRAKAEGRRVISVGTTSTRTLESAADSEGRVKPGEGWTDIFIYPGKPLRVIDGLITNFHLPKSTLLMLVSAFAGTEPVMAAYKLAVEHEYRFFSFGDAMLII
ncbi:MAG TPA: tRNA preQ1(34) S-adenosylmethionine ribosyltransferase-isomerase QueA [Bacillota bacterium]|nr:tRNA preQ1(34) S-adenosylmethionine ribosyltransferase-isomerase QueA [Bacillota bacterium]